MDQGFGSCSCGKETLKPIEGAPASAALAALALTACGSSSADSAEEPAAADDGRLQVVTTVAPLTSIVANVAGDAADITGIVPEGTNSHTFEPPPRVAADMEDADVVFVNGLQLEEPTLDLAEENAPDDARIRLVRRTPEGDLFLGSVLDGVTNLEERLAAEVGPRRYAAFRRVLADLTCTSA